MAVLILTEADLSRLPRDRAEVLGCINLQLRDAYLACRVAVVITEYHFHVLKMPGEIPSGKGHPIAGFPVFLQTVLSRNH